jgi:hypothetical protein
MVDEEGIFKQRIVRVAVQYIFFLFLQVKDHHFEAAGEIFDKDASRYSHFLNNEGTRLKAGQLHNRATRRRLAKLKIEFKDRIIIILDSTLWGRKGRKIENKSAFNHGKGAVYGHKFINIGILTSTDFIPIESLPYYSKTYCKEHNIKFKTENEIAIDWIFKLPFLALFPKEDLKKVLFLMDAGYDCKELQRAIKTIGANFISALKTTRNVGGGSVVEYFKNHRNLKGKSIRLHVGSGGKNSRRTYSVRHSAECQLKGVGKIQAVCSKKRDGTKKYLATSDLTLTAREIVFWYSNRWAIETWHREMKQNFGFIECRCSKFEAIHAHVLFSLVAYNFSHESGFKKISSTEYLKTETLKELKVELTKFGGAQSARKLISAALDSVAA